MVRAFVLCLSLLGPAAAASDRDWAAWAQEAHKRHTLAGRTYDPALGKLSDPENGARPLLPDGIVLLGEVHDNPAHHRLRGWLVAEALRARPDRRPAVVFEHIRADQQTALDEFKAEEATDLFRVLEWDKSGWPPSSIFRPLFDSVVTARLPMYAGDPPRDRVKTAARGGLAALDAEERTRLGLDSVLPAPLDDALRQELVESHCGALPPQAMGGMALAQRYRDAHQADAVIRGAARHGSAWLIAGNGHVRSDRGVPWHIRKRVPDAPVKVWLFLEVEDGRTDPAAYVPRDPEGRAAADLVIFTERAERPDPCAAFRKDRK